MRATRRTLPTRATALLIGAGLVVCAAFGGVASAQVGGSGSDDPALRPVSLEGAYHGSSGRPWGLAGGPSCEGTLSATAGVEGQNVVPVPVVGAGVGGLRLVSDLDLPALRSDAGLVRVEMACSGSPIGALTVAVDPVEGQWAWTGFRGVAELMTAASTTRSALDLRTAGSCPVADGVLATVRGHGLPPQGYIVTGWTTIGAVEAGAVEGQGAEPAGAAGPTYLKVALAQTLETFAADIGGSFAFDGAYQLEVSCRLGLLPDSVGSFLGAMTVDGDAVTTVEPEASSLQLGRSPDGALEVSQSHAGLVTIHAAAAAEDLTATSLLFAGVLPAGTSTLPTVQATGSLRATLVPDAALIAAAAAELVSATTPSTPPAGSTAVQLDPVPPTPVGELVSLTAHVLPSDVQGTVSFVIGPDSAVLGAGPVVAGTATLTVADLAVGRHAIRARLAPTSGQGLEGSESALIEIEVTGGVPDVQQTPDGPVTVPALSPEAPAPPDEPVQRAAVARTVQAMNDSGALLMSLAADQDGQVDLVGAALAPDGRSLDSAGSIDAVEVTDTRGDAPGFIVTAQMADFVGVNTGTVVSAAYAGLEPLSGDLPSGVTTGPVAAPASPGSSTIGKGLAVPRLLLHADPGFIGSARVGGRLVLQFPTTTVPDDYQGFLILTVL